MSETRQFIFFMLCVVNLLQSAWTFSEVIGIRWAVNLSSTSPGDNGLNKGEGQ